MTGHARRGAGLLLIASTLIAACSSTTAPPDVGATTSPTTRANAAPAKTATPAFAFRACGTLAPNSITSGQGSGPNTFELHNAAGVAVALFSWPAAGSTRLGAYRCVLLEPGAPMSGLVSPLSSADDGYGCGPVIGYASDGAQMRLTIGTAGASAEFRLEYQFASAPPPRDIGDVLAAHAAQMVRVSGHEVPPDSGSPAAISFRDFTVERVPSCDE